jgi:hypothetical protein
MSQLKFYVYNSVFTKIDEKGLMQYGLATKSGWYATREICLGYCLEDSYRELEKEGKVGWCLALYEIRDDTQQFLDGLEKEDKEPEAGKDKK